MFLTWLKSLFRTKPEPKEVMVNFRLPNGNELQVSCIVPSQLVCKDHQEYSGVSSPTNNCNVCWEIYNQKRSRWVK